MSQIRVSCEHAFSQEKAADEVDTVLADLRDRSDVFDGVYPKWTPDRGECELDGDAFHACVRVGEKLVEVEMELRGMMSVFRPVIEGKIREIFQKRFQKA